MSKIKKTDYLCLSAMLRAREAKMLTRDKMEGILAEPGFAECARQLADCGYEDMSAMSTREINAALERHRAGEIADVYELCPRKAVVDVFRLKYEYHNAKVLVKAAGKTSELISGSGRTEPEELKRAYETGESTEISPVLLEAMNEAKVTLARTGNPQLADFILDKAYFAELRALADSIGDSFITEYVKVLIDSANIRIAVRTMAIKGDHTKLASALIPGGDIDVSAVEAAMESRDVLHQTYGCTIFAKAVEAKDMTAFELMADNAVNDFLADSERIAFGPSAVVGYLAAVENEIMAIRIILTGKKMGIDPDKLRERLRDCYV